MIPALLDVEVVASQSQGAYHVLTFKHPGLAAGSRPGQFVNVSVDPSTGFLRLPFSIAWSVPETGECAIVFDPIGEGTRWLSNRASGDMINIVAPLGHGFEVAPPEGADLIVGGGYGAAALVGLTTSLAERGRKVVALFGARSADRLLVDDQVIKVCEEVVTTTEDGSAGATGRVTDVLEELIAKHNVGALYACGPNPMLAALGQAGRRLGVPTQLAVEEFMACGIGVCWTCVIPVSTADGVKHHRACTEGPVFSGESLAWT